MICGGERATSAIQASKSFPLHQRDRDVDQIPRLGIGATMAKKAKAKAKLVRREYTKEDVKELRAHSKAQTPLEEISRLMDRTGGSLRQKAIKLGIPLGHRRRKAKGAAAATTAKKAKPVAAAPKKAKAAAPVKAAKAVKGAKSAKAAKAAKPAKAVKPAKKVAAPAKKAAGKKAAAPKKAAPAKAKKAAGKKSKK